ncbi:hypothetical protein [Enterobacter roggenkampii]|nr:hypothetical protein [Enterobacter roggenkampii]
MEQLQEQHVLELIKNVYDKLDESDNEEEQEQQQEQPEVKVDKKAKK